MLSKEQLRSCLEKSGGDLSVLVKELNAIGGPDAEEVKRLTLERACKLVDAAALAHPESTLAACVEVLHEELRALAAPASPAPTKDVE